MAKSNLYGNDEVWQNLVNEALINQVAHAYLFTGPQGIGKSTTAKEYIKYLLGASETLAKRIDAGNYLDLLYITKQDKHEIGIEMIRKTSNFFRQTPAEGYKKFVIIDSADDLNINAANALLKILEEPTKNTYIFLISHAANCLLSTIKSRCRLIKFKPLARKDLKLITNIDQMPQLEDFIAGSAGRAISCAQLEADGLYLKILTLINDNDILAINKFADKVTKDPAIWQLTLDLLEYIVSRYIKSFEQDQFNQIERELLLPIARTKTIEEWFNARDALLVSFCDLLLYNLDKKQILLFALNSLTKSLHN